MRTPRNERLNDGSVDGETGPERTCVLTRACRPKDQLIRLALSPDGKVAPDVRARAPGRGAYVGTDRAALDAANAKGKLKAALARAFRNEVAVPADLGERIEDALRKAALDRLGLEARGGTLLTGAERIEQAARMGKVSLLIHAGDAGEDGNRKLDQALRVGNRDGGGNGRGLVFPEPRAILSMALGRDNVVHVALTDAAAARRVAHAIDRWNAFTASPARASSGHGASAGIETLAGLEPAGDGGPGLADDDRNEGNA